MPTASMEDLIHIDKLGAALVFFSQGIPFIQAGQEFLRSKPVPHCGFDHNSYASPDSVNSRNGTDLLNSGSWLTTTRGLSL